jgi:hypothetical protein
MIGDVMSNDADAGAWQEAEEAQAASLVAGQENSEAAGAWQRAQERLAARQVAVICERHGVQLAVCGCEDGEGY